MITPLTHPSYDDIHKMCLRIVVDLGTESLIPGEIDYIVGISRGGLVPAVILSHILDVPVIPISYSSRDGEGDDRNHGNKLPAIHNEIISGTGRLPTLPSLLIVDDICDSGLTMKEVCGHYLMEDHPVYSAALYYKTSSSFRPMWYTERIEANDPWIVFPWE